MRADATVVAERHEGRRTRCTTLRSAPPLSLRDTPEGLHLVASAGGPLGGDDVRLDITVAVGATLTVRTTAAQVVLPGPRPGSSTTTVTARVDGGAGLRWLPEPMVLATACDHRATVTVRLASTASLVWREEVVLGRSAEPGGSLLQRLQVDRDGQPLLRNELALGPAWPGAEGPAGTGGARVVGTVVVVGPPARSLRVEARDGVRTAVCGLGEDAVLVSALASSREALHAVLASVAG